MKRILLLISLLVLGAPTFAVTPQNMPPPVTISTTAPGTGAAAAPGAGTAAAAGAGGGALPPHPGSPPPSQSGLGSPDQSWRASSGIHTRLRRPGCCEVVD